MSPAAASALRAVLHEVCGKPVDKAVPPRPISSCERVTVLGAGYTGLTTAAELCLRGYRVKIVAQSFGHQPPLTIVGTQSRRWPGSASSNNTFDSDDLLDRELLTIKRLLKLSNDPATGVKVIPALKLSRYEGKTWNRRPIKCEQRLRRAAEVQQSLRLAASPATVERTEKRRFEAAGYKTVDETQVVRIDTALYFRHLLQIVADARGALEIGRHLSADDVRSLLRDGHVVNCLGPHAQSVGGASGEYYSYCGEVLVLRECPRCFPYYIMDDDLSAGVMQMPNGGLYLSTAAPVGPAQSEATLKDSIAVCDALFGEQHGLSLEGGYESWKIDRPMRKEGFNIGASSSNEAGVLVQNSGHGGAGVAASWACAAAAADAFTAALPARASSKL